MSKYVTWFKKKGVHNTDSQGLHLRHKGCVPWVTLFWEPLPSSILGFILGEREWDNELLMIDGSHGGGVPLKAVR